MVRFAISFGVSVAAAYGFGRGFGDRPWWRRVITIQPIAIGAVLAVASIAIVTWLPDGARRAALAALIVGIAGEYVGFALIDRRTVQVSIEIAGAIGTVSLAITGWLLSPSLVWIGFLAHVGWDLLHHGHAKRIDTLSVPGWYPLACIVYNIPLAATAFVLR